MTASPRVLHVSLTDGAGGADIAAYRIFEATRSAGVDARMVVRHSVRAESEALEIPLARRRRWAADLLAQVALRVQKSSNPFHRSLNVIPTGGIELPGFKPDLVHLHWVGSNTLSIKEIQAVPVPIVWTLHDSWPFTGAEHHPSYPDDERFTVGYQRANRVHSTRADVDGWIWRHKHRAWHRDFHLVGPSEWITRQARRSLLMGSQHAVTIPNPLEPESLHQPDYSTKQDRQRVSDSDFVIVTAGMGGTAVHSKGWPILRDALQDICELGISVHLLMIGQAVPPKDVPSGVQCTVTGVLSGSDVVGRAMSCGDIFVTTSTIESFGLAAAEASAVGLPVIAPDASGLRDVVVDGVTGWLIRPGSVSALVSALVAARNDPVEAQHRGTAGRQRAQDLWSLQRVGRQYRALYEEILAGAVRF